MPADTMTRIRAMRRGEGYLPSLTGLRGLLAVIVFGTHFIGLGLTFDETSPYQSPTHHVLEWLFSRSGWAVSAFFMLSGFVLTWISKPDERARTFYQRRFAKIYPVHFVTTVIAIFLVAWTYAVPGWQVVTRHVFLVQTWFPDQFSYFGLNGVSWSLACEAFFYLCWPFLVPAIARMTTRGVYITIAVCTVVSIGLPALVGKTFALASPPQFEMVPTEAWGGPLQYWFAYVFPPARLPEFVIGIAFAILIRRGKWFSIGAPAAIVLCLVAWALNMKVDNYLNTHAVMMIPLALLVSALIIADRAAASDTPSPAYLRWSPLRGRAMVWFGEVSFSFYATHQLVVEQLGTRIWVYGNKWGLLPGDIVWPWYGVLGMWFLQFAVALGVAWVLYRTIEVPMMRLLRPRDGRRLRSAPEGELAPAAPVPPDGDSAAAQVLANAGGILAQEPSAPAAGR
ncbi:acyltransferase family protein [Micromonospora sp. PTRAS2]